MTKRFREDDPDLNCWNPDSYSEAVQSRYALEHKHYSLLKWIKELKKYGKKRVLDVGCGSGVVTLELVRSGFSTVSVDASKAMLNHLEKNLPENKRTDCRCVLADCKSLPFPDGFFDGILCFGLLHHVDDYEAAVREQIRTSAANGAIYIAEPYEHRPWISYFYNIAMGIGKFIRNAIYARQARMKEVPLNRTEVGRIVDLLKIHKFECEVQYLAYWPVAVSVLPQAIALMLTRLLNFLNFSAERGDSVLIAARKT